jgi:hypothetical protein
MKEVICQNCGYIVWTSLFPFRDLEKVDWVIGFCPFCSDIAYRRRGHDYSSLSGHL